MSAGNKGAIPSWLIPIIILVIAAAIIAYFISTKPAPETQESKEKEWLVSTQTIRFGEHRPELELLGVVESPFATKLAAVISSEVESIGALEGEQVNQGDVLIRLDTREIKLVVQQRKAELDELDAQVQSEINRHRADILALESEKALRDISKKALERQATLSASNLVAQERYENAQSDYARQQLTIINRELSIEDHPQRLAQLKARRDKAATALQDAKLDLTRSTVRAPFDGAITAVHVAPGDRVNLNQTLVEMYDSATVEIRAQLPNHAVTAVKSALQHGDTLAARTPNTPLSLARLSGRVNDASGGMDAFFSPQTSKHLLSLNSRHKLVLSLPAVESTLDVPLSAIYGTNRMYLVEDGRLAAINVDIVGRTFSANADERVIVTGEALAPGQSFIVTQLPNAITGLKVTTRE